MDDQLLIASEKTAQRSSRGEGALMASKDAMARNALGAADSGLRVRLGRSLSDNERTGTYPRAERTGVHNFRNLIVTTPWRVEQ